MAHCEASAIAERFVRLRGSVVGENENCGSIKAHDCAPPFDVMAGLLPALHAGALAVNFLIHGLPAGMAGPPPAMTREGWATGLTELDTPAPRSRGEPLAEHRQAADRLRRGRLVLKNVPMLGEPAVFEAHDVGGDPRRGTTVAGKTAVGDHIIPSGEDDVIFIAQRIRQGANEIEQAIAARRNMGAVLDVSVRPEALCGGVVAFVEQRVEGFENKRLVLRSE